ncbi:serine-rich adhesin for platelets [Pempheris klunzingeri]|uniref:serine-rich adhesin for platelets n=1 Tax=Pempheris klunzingeri TaxID=3127111 RepID=UPI00397F6671
MAKTSSRRSLKSLFSRSEATLDVPAEKDADKSEGEKRKFRLPKFKTKPKSDSASEKPPANEKQQLLSAGEPSNTAKDGETWVDNIVVDSKRPSLHATAPRAKSKELSYSELDLHKPKRFATFSFGLRKKKKDGEESISKSTYGLHSLGIEEQEETPQDLSQMELGQANMQTTCSRSQPKLDASEKFDIPSPPPVATNQSESYFTLPDQSQSPVTVNTQPETQEPLTDGSSLFEVHKEPQKVPIATIPELQLDYPGSSENENIPAHDNLSKSDAYSPAPTTNTESTFSVDDPAAPIPPDTQPPTIPDTSDHKAAVVDSVSSNNNNKTEIILTESTGVTLSHHQPDAYDVTDSKPSLGSVDATIAESTPVPPPVATNQSESYFTLPNQSQSPVTVNTQPETEEPLTDGSSLFEVHKEPQKAPIATIPELQLNCPGSSENENIPAHDNLSKSDAYSPAPTTNTESTSSVDDPAAPIPPDTQPPTIPDTLDHKAAVVDSVSSNNNKTETILTESTGVTLSHHQPDAYDVADSKPSLGSVDATIAESTPVPPPVATNQSESYFTLPDQSQSPVTVNTQPETQEPLTDGSSLFEVPKEPQKAPIATIPKLQLDYPGSPENENIPAHDNISKSDAYSPAPTTNTESTSSVDDPAAPIPPDTQPPTIPDTLDHKAAVVDSVSSNNNKTETILTESTGVTLSHHQPDVADSKPSLGSVDVTIAESTPVPHSDNSALKADSVSVHDEVPISRSEGSSPEAATGVTTTSAVSSEKNPHPVNQDVVYEELYESLFPPSFTSEVMSSSSNPPPQGVVNTINECHTETNVLSPVNSRLSTSREFDSAARRVDDAVGDHANTNATFSETRVIASSESSSYQTPPASELHRDADIRCRYLPPSLKSGSGQVDIDKIPYSELTRSLSEVKSDCFSSIQDTATSGPVLQNSAPPVSDYVTSQGTDTQVTDSKRRVILVKELVTDEASTDPGCPTPGPERMSAAKGVQIKIETTESFSAPPGHMDGYVSPAYLSVGSDDGGAMEIYYSAPEDNTEDSGDEEMYTLDEREDNSVVDAVRDFKPREEFPQQGEIAETGVSKRQGGEFRVAIVKKQDEGGIMGYEEKKEDVTSHTEMERLSGQSSEAQVRLTGSSEFLEGNDAKSQEKEIATAAFPQMREEGQEVREEELVATPVQLMSSLIAERGVVAERGVSKRDEGEFRVVIVKVQSDGGTMGSEEKKEDVNSQTEVQQQLSGPSSEVQVQESETSESLVGNYRQSQEKEAASAAFSQVKGEGWKERQEELLATPVQQVNRLMVCDLAPPSIEQHERGEGSEGNWTEELETQDHPIGEKQLLHQEMQYLACEDTRRSVYKHTPSSHTREEATITPQFRVAGEQVSVSDKRGEASTESAETNTYATTSAATDTCGGEEVVTGTLTRRAELQSDATVIEHNRAPQSSEWVDTITQSQDSTRTVREQVAVELSALSADTCLPDIEAADTLSDTLEHPAEAQPDLSLGSLKASGAALEDQLTKADQEPADKMNSGYSSLSTTLSIKSSSPPKENDSIYRFHKVSLISEADGTEGSQDTEDFSKASTTVTELNGAEPDSKYKWRNRFEGVTQYKLCKAEDSLSYRMSDTHSGSSPLSSSSSSAPPEASAYRRLGNAFSSTTSSSSPFPEEHITLGNRLNDSTGVYLSRESEQAGERKDERSVAQQEEPAAPAGVRERQAEGESERIKSHWDSQQLPVSDNTDSLKEDNNSSCFTGVFKATLVELVSDPAAPPSTPPASPEEESPHQFDMDSLVDTLKSMGSSLRPRNSSVRAPAPVLVSSLPPIVEDAASPVTPGIPTSLTSPTKMMEAKGKAAESLNGLYTLPADLGLRRGSSRDTRSPMELMKQSHQDQQPGTRGLSFPLRASAFNSIVMRKSSDSSPEDLLSPVFNENGVLLSPNSGSRLDNSVIFGSYRAASIDQTFENRMAHRPLFHTSSLPEICPTNDRMSVGPRELSELGVGTDQAGSRFERFSFLLNSSSSGSLTGAEDPNARISRPPPLSISSPPSSNSPTRLLSPTSSIDLHRPFTTIDSPLSMFGQTQGMGMGMGMGMGVGTGALGTPILQRSFSSEGTAGVQQTSLFNSVYGGSQFQSQDLEAERNLASKYRAFPDAYRTKTKEHGKLNPRPGKMYIFDQPGMCGQRIEVRSDVIDATPWVLQETISIRVIRGGWVLYEKPNFKGEKIALDEGDIELTYPFDPPEEQLQNGQKDGEKQSGEQNGEGNGEETETKPTRRFIIGSVRRAVRDYSVPEVSLFPEENAEGKKIIFRDTSDDARIFGFPIKANSIIINAGLWLVYAHPFFQGVPRVLEVGGYTNPAAWGVEHPYVGSLHPLKIGEPRVENMSEPKMVIYDKPYFTGKSRTISASMRNFMTRTDMQQTAFMYSVGSLKVVGGIWVGYEKEGFRGHQYLLEEGEYHDWRVWGGCDSELRSVRVIRADLTDPLMVMFEHPEEEQEEMQEENTFEVAEAINDVELLNYKTSTRSIHVLSGAWIAYSHVDFSGNQYILEKGFYNNCADWGSQDSRICSVQPILPAPSDSSRNRNEVILYSEPNFQGQCHVFDRNQEAVPEKFLTKSCRVSKGSWALYENKQYSGNLYVLSEGEYPNLTSMGCLPGSAIRSLKAVPMTFSVPSISLFGLECLEGREITTETEILSMVEEGFNNHILSVRVNSGSWVICEHTNYRGRQFLLEPIEITNWPKFSSLQTIGSLYPVRQKRHFFRIKYKESGHFMSIQGGVAEMKSGRVVVTPEVESMSDIWFYQDGLIKSKLSPTMSLQVMGNIEPAAKVVLWTETRQPIQTWTAQMRGLITSLTFPGMVLDVKGGKSYDKDHVVIMPESEERSSQQWEIEML